MIEILTSVGDNELPGGKGTPESLREGDKPVLGCSIGGAKVNDPLARDILINYE